MSSSYTPYHYTYTAIVDEIISFDFQHHALNSLGACSDPEKICRTWIQEEYQNTTTETAHQAAPSWAINPLEGPGSSDDEHAEGWFGTIDWNRLDAVVASLRDISDSGSDNAPGCDCGMEKAAASSGADSNSISCSASGYGCLALFQCPAAHHDFPDEGVLERHRNLATQTEGKVDYKCNTKPIDSGRNATSHTHIQSSLGKKELTQRIKLGLPNTALEMEPSSAGGHIVGSQTVPGQSDRKARQVARSTVPGKPKRSYRKVQSGEMGFYRGDGEAFIPIGARPIRGRHKSAMLMYQKEAEEERGRVIS